MRGVTRGAMPTRLNELIRVFRDQNSSRRWASPRASCGPTVRGVSPRRGAAMLLFAPRVSFSVDARGDAHAAKQNNGLLLDKISSRRQGSVHDPIKLD
ncbi:hypothetical protein LF1_38990 [Rubripirellula obstinata]|uniref:Uncharacterized protein n=1 Tax=Rubripirellula obstinata TaxID=406547 RepID=A0A5B1CLZ5_9BACT|nr:hypothetical protein LF1_38990 [Rubripirellula obstinata]